MRVRRSKLTADFVQVPNGTCRDHRLSYMARGILAELLSRPDGWETTADELWRGAIEARGEDAEGRRAFRAAFAELKAAGYMESSRERLDGGRVSTVLTVYDLPQISGVPPSGTPEPPGQTYISAGETDVPHAGTPEARTDIPPGGTSEPSGETRISAGGADVPSTGTSVRPAETGIYAGRTDVPHAGTSNKKTGFENGVENVSLSAPGSLAVALPVDERENHLDLFTKQLMGEHGATAAEVGAILSDVRREQRVYSLPGWAASPTGRTDIALRLADLRRRAVVVAPRADCPECVGGWLGEDEDGRPRPCTHCKPHVGQPRQPHEGDPPWPPGATVMFLPGRA